ncbi:hypothetical protein BCR34DRAFT_475547 [Clohesyomyces aquaticus]|uniref:SGNH hydrolase-type esterase domain-containing protein n=1 Tax=Clohesyomyces aquaticus TaxID=1231657 RepID=A0A1Y2A346_9PLEO|nr:hypothetical protein BCR34DRAFT_475547 [Clohesyomyces aquaticus]
MASSTNPAGVNHYAFYNEWKGHRIEHLEMCQSVIQTLRPRKPVVYLAGDSSLDNKAWIPSAGRGGELLPVDVPEIYESILNRPRPKPDVAFWLNHFLGERATALNTAVEESMLRQRFDELLPQDKFIRDNITSDDILIVSVGANDIALRPTYATIWNMLRLAWLTGRKSLENGSASALSYFQELFGEEIETYVNRLCFKTKPRLVLICMIYFPLESAAGPQQSWAEMQLKALGYNSYPTQLQTGIRTIFEQATKNIKVEGTEVVPFKLFEVLDGKNVEDYVARVEPSVQGGRKMGEAFVKILESKGVIDQPESWAV